MRGPISSLSWNAKTNSATKGVQAFDASRTALDPPADSEESSQDSAGFGGWPVAQAA